MWELGIIFSGMGKEARTTGTKNNRSNQKWFYMEENKAQKSSKYESLCQKHL
jgi:hypothetical protein